MTNYKELTQKVKERLNKLRRPPFYFDKSVEKIVCSAIWYKDLCVESTEVFRPVNIGRGIVVAGLRHAHCINTVKLLSGLRSVKLGPDSVGENVQGFLTTHNRFLDRKEAADLYEKYGGTHDFKDLFSEDLY